jgi:hypothetical protein
VVDAFPPRSGGVAALDHRLMAEIPWGSGDARGWWGRGPVVSRRSTTG